MKGLAWYQDEDNAPSKHEPPDPPLRRRPPTPAEVSRERRRIFDVYAPYLRPDGSCDTCGGRNGHGGACPLYLAEQAWCRLPGCADGNPWHEHKDGAA